MSGITNVTTKARNAMIQEQRLIDRSDTWYCIYDAYEIVSLGSTSFTLRARLAGEKKEEHFRSGI